MSDVSSSFVGLMYEANKRGNLQTAVLWSRLQLLGPKSRHETRLGDFKFCPELS
ncbi:hypothetical protein FOQG_09408 [Fusarium oxysporum f. sp. raphani 54005]|uniref:Uncharacterized protein n=3 Tax=Fusarium oxysporum TaxID=5507 RepID=X0C8H6_FUSOX|nr:hypothetical protein FOVG_06531 [Fusarium oxysporum f. sp. pisi HDV247]EXK87134.1 hypothetical protein FOQG_09408 [Fusarium oxysporum f. sp. raphani 54005]EXL74590.1 hypothetical protein FOPG_10340 [Fusarium oxysporum f. sp. conglutinans race 2 54008]